MPSFQPIRLYLDDKGRIGVGQIVVTSPGADPVHMVSWDRGGYAAYYSPAAMERNKIRQVAEMPLASFLEQATSATTAASLLATLSSPLSLEQGPTTAGGGVKTVRVPKKDISGMGPEEAAEEIKQRLLREGLQLDGITVTEDAETLELVYTGTTAKGATEAAPDVTTREVIQPSRPAQ